MYGRAYPQLSFCIKNMSRLKNVDVSQTFFDLCESFGLLLSPDLRMKKFAYWEYYEVVKREKIDRDLKKKIYQQIYHLERFSYFGKNGLSQKGILKLIGLKIKKEENKNKWDKKWRIIIFDIPEKQRRKRDGFRRDIQNLGFKKLQNSIWISPFGDLSDIQIIAKGYKIEKYVVFIAADKISNDLLYRKKFEI